MKKAFIGIGMLAVACFMCAPALAVEGVPHSPLSGKEACSNFTGTVQAPAFGTLTNPYGAPVTYSGPTATGAGSLPLFALMPLLDNPVTSWPAAGSWDFCAAFDTASCSLGGLATLAASFDPDIPAQIYQYMGLFICSTDINGPVDLTAEIPVTPNGIPDGEFELGLLAAVLNNTYALDTTKTGGVSNADVLTAYKANFNYVRVLVTTALSAIPTGDSTLDARPLVPSVAPWLPSGLVTIIAGLATEGDPTTMAALNQLLGLLDQIGMTPPPGGLESVTDGFPDILAPDGNPDGDVDNKGKPWTNRREFNYFRSQGAAITIQAQLTGTISPPNSVSSLVISGGGTKEEGDSLTLTATVLNGSAMTYAWTKNGASTGVTAAQLVIPVLALTDSGKYVCTVVTDADETIDAETTVNVVPQGQLPIAGGLGLALLAGACALGGVGSIRRRK